MRPDFAGERAPERLIFTPYVAVLLRVCASIAAPVRLDLSATIHTLRTVRRWGADLVNVAAQPARFRGS
jgi:hypothetical protein